MPTERRIPNLGRVNHMHRMWHQMFSAVAGMLAIAGAASAQYQVPNTFPSIPPQPAIPMPMPTSPVALPSPYLNGHVAPVSGGFNGPNPVTVQGQGVCGVIGQVRAQPPIQYGEYCPTCANGCGNYKHDLGFIFGSCKSYFSPCGPEPCTGCSGTGTHRFGGLCKGGRCGVPPFGKPYATGGPCKYDSYLDH